MPTTYGNARDFVAIRPMPSPSHIGLKVTARCSTPVYTCEIPRRPEIAKQNYERRDHQIQHCGYRSLNYKPYKEVGEVILDERELILRALGQYTADDQGKEDDSASRSWFKQLNSNASEAKDVIALVQPKIENLQTLHQQLGKGRLLLNKVKLGIDLFRLIREERKKKVFASEKKRIQDEAESKTSMRAAEETVDHFNTENDAADISKYIVSSFASKRNTFDSREGLFANFLKTRADKSEHHRDKHDAVANGNLSAEDLDSLAADEVERENGINGERNSRTSVNGETRMEAQDSNSYYPMHYKNKTSRAKVSNSRKFTTSLPRPFSPVFTNVNFYETQSMEHTFKQLCALHWILEAMSLDQPAAMPAISTCWNLSELKQDLTTAHRKADREKAVEPIWKAFLSNPKKFTRGKTSKRGALLQRRISIAPSALRRMSAASNASLTSGSKLSSIGDETRASSGTPNDSSKLISRGRTYSKIGPNTADGSPVPRKISHSAKKISVSKMEDTHLQQSQISSPTTKEKAFIIREVVIARSAFARKESRASKGRLPLSKGTTDVTSKKGGKSEQRERLSSESKSIAINKHQQSLDGDASILDPSPQTADEEKVPSSFKEMFRELATENALVLHDRLEQREKASIESMERKFHALRVMSDVHRALSTMRSKSRLKVETDEEKKARFSEECSWYKCLLENLPAEVRDNNYNALVLDKIAKYGSLEGRKISSSQLIKVLSTLRPWELCYPDISAAIEFVRDKVVGMDKGDFEVWFQSRIGEQSSLEMSFNKSEA